MTITSLPLDTRTAASARATEFLRAVARNVVAVLRALKNRHDMELLASQDDRMLSDIGLTRGDVRDAISQPLWRDPTAILVTRVYEKRRWRLNRPVTIQGPSLVPRGFGETVVWPTHARRY
jgi:uncharacterized protein YjiS (DUF1127 family)